MQTTNIPIYKWPIRILSQIAIKIIDICLKIWTKKECEDIATTKIWIGMEKEQLILAWGLPNDRNNSVYSFGINSQWVYGNFGPYVYLEGKDKSSMKVTSWQD
jgi:hypothetical protein